MRQSPIGLLDMRTTQALLDQGSDRGSGKEDVSVLTLSLMGLLQPTTVARRGSRSVRQLITWHHSQEAERDGR